MSYATVADIRAEGVTEFEADDARLGALLAEATATIDAMTGWFFEPRSITFRLDGRGTPTLEPPVPAIRVDSITIDGTLISLAPEDIIVVGAPVQFGFAAPRITRCHGVFRRGCGNVEIQGLWGYTEPDTTDPNGRVPYEIWRVCMLMVLRWIYPLADSDADGARNAWRVISMRTRDQSVSFQRPGPAGPFTGDPEIDRVLFRYRRPQGLGAA